MRVRNGRVFPLSLLSLTLPHFCHASSMPPSGDVRVPKPAPAIILPALPVSDSVQRAGRTVDCSQNQGLELVKELQCDIVPFRIKKRLKHQGRGKGEKMLI